MTSAMRCGAGVKVLVENSVVMSPCRDWNRMVDLSGDRIGEKLGRSVVGRRGTHLLLGADGPLLTTQLMFGSMMAGRDGIAHHPTVVVGIGCSISTSHTFRRT